ncbi:MAG: zeta toxin family protein [Tabrizicola sp.]
MPDGGHASPRCLFVVGHQGSGKTTCVDKLTAELGADRTQRIVPDELVASIDLLHGGTVEATALREAYSRTHCATHSQRLADHAIARRAHIVWERALPGNIERLALAVRQLGYRVECLVLATPVEESWLGTLRRCLAAIQASAAHPMHVPWPLLSRTALRWPGVLDRLEQTLCIDRIAVIDREGEVCFDNQVEGPPNQRRWSDPPFAFESLMVERARPRSATSLAALLADWEALQPQIAAINHPNWPTQDLAAFDTHLRALVADPASQFDLNAPNPDPAVVQAWIARLKADLAAAERQGDTGDQPSLAARSTRLLQLVSQVAGQPTR